MKRDNLIIYLARGLNFFVTFAVVFVIFLWATEFIHIGKVELAITQFRETVAGFRILIVAGVALILILNLVAVLRAARTSSHVSHIRKETDDGEFLVSVKAAEETLERAVESLAEIYDVSVKVLIDRHREEDKIRIRATCSTQEKTKFQDVVDQVKGLLRERFAEIIELDEEPYFEIILGRVVDESAEKEDTEKRDTGQEEDPYLSETFSGPEYPVEDEE